MTEGVNFRKAQANRSEAEESRGVAPGGGLSIGSLFSGIGGLELGLEWSGLGPVLWQVEKDPFCRRVLAKHWPEVERHEDVRSVRASQLQPVGIICGGFPCQDVSSAGKRKGLTGERSGLWFEFWRILKEARPRFVVVENVASGASKWLRPVRHHLHMLGYRTRALGVAASDVGAPHVRRRVFVVADADGFSSGGAARSQGASASSDSDCDKLRVQHGRRGGAQGRSETVTGGDGEARGSADANGPEGNLAAGAGSDSRGSWNGGRLGSSPVPAVRRVDDGVPRGMDAARKRALGNAVVPQCAQVVGEVIRQLAEGGTP